MDGTIIRLKVHSCYRVHYVVLKRWTFLVRNIHVVSKNIRRQIKPNFYDISSIRQSHSLPTISHDGLKQLSINHLYTTAMNFYLLLN